MLATSLYSGLPLIVHITITVYSIYKIILVMNAITGASCSVCCLNWYLLKLKFTWRAAGAPKRSRWTRPSSRIRNLVDLEYVNRAYRLQWQNKQPIAWWHFSEFTIGLSFNKSHGIQWRSKQLNARCDTFPNIKWCHSSIWTVVRILVGGENISWFTHVMSKNLIQGCVSLSRQSHKFRVHSIQSLSVTVTPVTVTNRLQWHFPHVQTLSL